MELDKAIKWRHMVRKYKSDPVPDELIKKLLFNARQAPSAGFMQPAEWIIVKSQNQKTKLAHAALSQMWISEAPVVIVAVANTSRPAVRYGERGVKFYSIIDTAFGVENLLLTARAESVGASFVGAFHDDEVSKILDLPSHVRPIGIIAIGWPDEPAAKYERLPMEQIVHEEKW
jgi:nitroreductase